MSEEKALHVFGAVLLCGFLASFLLLVLLD